ncbi:MAG: hypothetical protein AAF842_08510 [Planctomycetota bacterium]
MTAAMYAAPTDPELWRAWHEAAGEAAVVEAIEAVHRRIGEAVAQRGPRCDQSGRCCRFGDYGHDLYVTGLEIAVFRRRAAEPVLGATESGKVTLPQLGDERVCPYMVDRSCSVHAARPAGCRIFFCEPGTQDWQQGLYEQSLDAIRQLHNERGLPYRYMEWLDGLTVAQSEIVH